MAKIKRMKLIGGVFALVGIIASVVAPALMIFANL